MSFTPQPISPELEHTLRTFADELLPKEKMLSILSKAFICWMSSHYFLGQQNADEEAAQVLDFHLRLSRLIQLLEENT